MTSQGISRRKFLVGTVVGLTALGGAGFIGSQSPAITFTEPTFSAGKSKILVAYCSQYGTTGEVAEAVGKSLNQEGFSVDVRQISNVADISGYKAAFIGSPIHSSKWMHEGVSFVERNKLALTAIPVAYFLTCMTLGLTSQPAARDKVAAAFAELREKAPEIKPIATAMFAGALDYKKMSALMKLMYMAFAENSRSGDYRDWNAITAWGQQSVLSLS